MVLTGQINRRKNQQELSHNSAQRSSWAPTRHGPYGNAPFGRGRGRAGKALHPPRRHRSLILNNSSGASSANVSPKLNSSPFFPNESEGENTQTGLPQGWIAKNDRHRQLINPAIYEREMLARTRDLENTRQIKAAQKDAREQAKIQRHLQSLSGQPTGANSAVSSTGERPVVHEVVIQGVPFRVTNGGSRLLRTTGNGHCHPRCWISEIDLLALDTTSLARSTPKTASVGGVTFLRSKNGNLYRSGIVKNKR